MGRFRRVCAGWSVALAVVATTVMSAFTGQARAADPTVVDDPAASAHLLTLANADRTAAGLPLLEARLDVTDVAIAHSRRMAAAGDISHNDDYFTSESRQRLGARSLGENVALNTSADDAHRRLMLSAGHRANLMNPKFTVVGMAVVRNLDGVGFITQDFVEPAAGPRPPVDPEPAPSAPGPQPPAAPDTETAPNPGAPPPPIAKSVPPANPGRTAPRPGAATAAPAPAPAPVDGAAATAVEATTTTARSVSVVTEPISNTASPADAAGGGTSSPALVAVGLLVLAMVATAAVRTWAARRPQGGPTDSGM